MTQYDSTTGAHAAPAAPGTPARPEHATPAHATHLDELQPDLLGTEPDASDDLPYRAPEDATPQHAASDDTTSGDTTSGGRAGAAKDGVENVAGEAKERATDVLHEATHQARGLVDRTRSELGQQAGNQQTRLAEGLRSASAELSRMADTADEPGYASEVVRRAASAGDRAATWLDDRDPQSVLDEVSRFARRRPVLFLAIAASAGLVVGRLARSLRDSPSDTDAARTVASAPRATTRTAEVDDVQLA